MVREYLKQNVYEALQDRLKFIFEEFDNWSGMASGRRRVR